MKNKLITALRASARALEENTFSYDWCEANKCNAGIVVLALTGKSQKEFKRYVDQKDICHWQDYVGERCPVTGIPNDKLLRELFSHGLTGVDIVQLENLSNPKVLARMNLGTRKAVVKSFLLKKEVQVPVEVERDNKEHLITYLRAFADLLVEEGQLDTVETTKSENQFRQPVAVGT